MEDLSYVLKEAIPSSPSNMNSSCHPGGDFALRTEKSKWILKLMTAGNFTDQLQVSKRISLFFLSRRQRHGNRSGKRWKRAIWATFPWQMVTFAWKSVRPKNLKQVQVTQERSALLSIFCFSIHWCFFSTESDLTRLNMIIWNTIRNKKQELGRGAEAFGGFWTLLLEWISLMGQGENGSIFKLRLIYNILNKENI